MTAYRSLNKLERKAHMSIHEKLEVAEEEFIEPSYTRDRFGKRQNVDSSELEPFDLNKQVDPDERFKFYEDENTVVGFNEEGDPSVGKRF